MLIWSTFHPNLGFMMVSTACIAASQSMHTNSDIRFQDAITKAVCYFSGLP